WIYSISYFHLVLIYRSGEGVLDAAGLKGCHSHTSAAEVASDCHVFIVHPILP
ncbi:hypothetical protein KUCAC02_002319, partial [Chaenocephalus aceratus]